MVQALLAERFEVRLSHSSVCRLLIQLGLTAQRPLWRAYQQDPGSIGKCGLAGTGDGVSGSLDG